MEFPESGVNENDPTRTGEVDLGSLVQEPAASAEATPTATTAPTTYEIASELTPREVHDFFTALDKAVRARRLYAANNPAYQAFLAALRSTISGLWDGAFSLSVVVEEHGFRWEDQVFAAGEGRETLSFQFYKDGIRGLTFLPGFEQEVERFLDVLARARHIDSSSSDDMVTLLWEQEFGSLLYNYVDALAEGLDVPQAAPLPTGKIELTLVSADITGSDQSQTMAPPAVQRGEAPVAQAISCISWNRASWIICARSWARRWSATSKPMY
jgi:hypothetical protein